MGEKSKLRIKMERRQLTGLIKGIGISKF
jgi:hypothetical protein